MTETAFTPGPWIAGEIDENLGYDCMTAGVRAGPVVLDAADYGQTRCDDLPHYIEEKMLADAHLIAAAPDLYEALSPLEELATQQAADAPEWYADDGVKVYLTIGELRRAVAALSKARGEDQ